MNVDVCLVELLLLSPVAATTTRASVQWVTACAVECARTRKGGGDSKWLQTCVARLVGAMEQF